MNHAAFYDKMKRTAETMTKIQKNEDNISVAEYLRDSRYSGEWINIAIEDEKDNAFFKDFLFTITYYSDPDEIVNNCFRKLNYYLDNSLKGSDTEEKENNVVRTNHDRIVEEMQTLRESINKYSNKGVEKNVKGLKDFAEVVLTTLSPDEPSDREFVVSLIKMIRYYEGAKLIDNMKAKLDDYLTTEEQKEEEKKDEMTKTSHEEMIEMAVRIRSILTKLRVSNASDDDIATNAFSIINNLKSKLPVADNNDDRFIKQMVEITHNCSGLKLVDCLVASIDQWYEFKDKDSNLLSIDELAKKIANKRNMNANNVGFTILSGMMDLVVQSTNKLVDNIEEEEYLNIVDKEVVRRDLNILAHAYSNILEILGQYYVKLEK